MEKNIVTFEQLKTQSAVKTSFLVEKLKNDKRNLFACFFLGVV